MYSPQMANMPPPGQHGQFMPQGSPAGPHGVGPPAAQSGPPRPGQVPPPHLQKGPPPQHHMYYQQPGPSKSPSVFFGAKGKELIACLLPSLLHILRYFMPLLVPGMPYPPHFMQPQPGPGRPQGGGPPPMEGGPGPGPHFAPSQQPPPGSGGGGGAGGAPPMGGGGAAGESGGGVPGQR